MPRPARGFTLIEQLIAITLAGAASAAALPGLAGLQAQANATALQHLAGAAGSAMALNKAGCLVTNQQVVAGKCQPVADCSQVDTLLQAGLPAGYRVLQQALPAPAPGAEALCQLLDDKQGASASFRAYPSGA